MAVSMKQIVVFDATHCVSESGGISGYLNDHLEVIKNHEMYHVVIALPEGTKVKKEFECYEIFRIKKIYPIFRTLLNRFTNYKRINQNFPTAIIVNPYYDQLVYGKKSVITVHDLAFFESGLGYPLKIKLFYGVFLLLNSFTSCGAILISKSLSEQFLRVPLNYLFYKKNLYFLPNRASGPLQLKASQRTGDYFLYFGGNEQRKNVQLIHDLAKVERKSYFSRIDILYTGTPWRKNLEAELEANGIRARCLGFLSAKELHEYIAGSKGVIYPSLSEGFGRPIQEAGLYKKPCICLNLPVYREFFGDSPNYIVNDPEVLLKEMVDILRGIQTKHVKCYKTDVTILDVLRKLHEK